MPQPWITEDDLYYFNEGTHARLYRTLGAQQRPNGVSFAVWAPDAAAVHVIGDFNGWSDDHPLSPVGHSGIWQTLVEGLGFGALYKLRITAKSGQVQEKTDPFAFHCEIAPKTAAVVQDLSYTWGDEAWMSTRATTRPATAPLSVYELHLGSWMRPPEAPHVSLGYRDAAVKLADYVAEQGYTHVEFMPLTEHPYYPSWGYQTTGYFAPTSRYGTPQDLMYLIDTLHQRGIGVILDWVPSHFPSDAHGLALFDGTHLYEHADPRKGYHPDWNSLIFNYNRHEVRAFLISSAAFWADVYHIDALRVDAVASMLYLDYSRQEGEWIPNVHGGRENLEAIAFLRQLNDTIHREHPGVFTIAEESTSWPKVSHPTEEGGLGFDFKWDMGWMHDTLSYLARDPIHRRYHHNELTFRGMYQFSERFVMALSHDEVVHLKGSMPEKMAGDDWQRLANLRLLYTQQWLSPGKKHLFMGMDIGQWSEWAHDRSVDWHLLEHPNHRGLQRLVRDLNTLYRGEPGLFKHDHSQDGFEWVDPDNADESLISFLRRGEGDTFLVLLNFTPLPREDVPFGVPVGGHWAERFNSDAPLYEGSGKGNLGGLTAQPSPLHGRPFRLTVTLPPLGGLIFKAPR
ncbi:1,4-alpha-glucan branching protein GlgB [Myxococcota bacterium]|nr:1,4-alpha-glucan branching protein GlgB [Myxococcota bacterium]MBU1429355.1 1,4-alpha-glucan branching protein GlgB [Myxococcota bacterium]MBU1899587.1 1,4-alpha-glucan branching protein GlgB [Myxococcota bacterium]